jgi:hypothetical protein
MAIFSLASDLETREMRYVPRNVATDKQSTFAGQIQAHEGWWFAGCHADRYADDVVIPDIDAIELF